MVNRVAAKLRNCHERCLSKRRDIRELILENLLRSPRDLLYFEELLHASHRHDRVVFAWSGNLRVDTHRFKHTASRRIMRERNPDLPAFFSMPLDEDTKAHREHWMDRELKPTTVDLDDLWKVVRQREVLPPAI